MIQNTHVNKRMASAKKDQCFGMAQPETRSESIERTWRGLCTIEQMPY